MDYLYSTVDVWPATYCRVVTAYASESIRVGQSPIPSEQGAKGRTKWGVGK